MEIIDRYKMHAIFILFHGSNTVAWKVNKCINTEIPWE
jgi:hypothetical protein